MRRMFLKLIAATSLGTMAVSIASAADMGVVRKAPPPPAAVASWSGLYLGLGFGTSSTRTDAAVTAHTLGGVDVLAQTCANAAPLGGCFSGEPLNDTAFRINPYVGFNWQIAPQWVVGIEADAGFGNKTTTINGMRYPATSTVSGLAADSFSVKTSWDASARGRVGFLPDPSVLLYATGGAAWLHVESTSNCSTGFACGAGGLSPAVITDARTKTGWTVGGGLEAMLWANWIARAEYRYADFGTISHTDTRIDAGVAEVVSYDVRVRTHTATFGLAYKFDGSAPTAATAPVKAPVYKAPPAVAVASWTGLYAGLGVGTRSTRTEATVTNFTFSAGASLAGTCAAFAPFGGCLTSQPLNDTAFRLSPYLGLNWQVAPQWVLGVEADWGVADKTTTLAGVSYPVSGFMSGLATETFSVKTTWDASARGRVGFLTSPSVLVYATGGATWLHVESTGSCNALPACPGFAPVTITNSHTKTGWTVGGGLEAMLWGNWIARGEYRYADFGTISNTDVRTLGPNVFTVNYDLRVKTHLATFGLAYKFDWSKPVVAKY
jgi:outer membrane immunogenic protein